MKMKKRYIVLISIFVLLLVIRLILPYVAKSYINRELANIEGYDGSIEDLSMSLYKGAFNIGGLVINEEASEDPETPFIRLPSMDFDLNLAFENINLVKFNNFMEAYASLELKSGTLSVFSESVVKDKEIEGYVNPIIENFDVDRRGEDKNLPEKVYEAVVDFFAGVIENPKEEQIDSRVEISGTVENIENNPWQAVFNLLRNACIEAYSKEIENAINFRTVSGERD